MSTHKQRDKASEKIPYNKPEVVRLGDALKLTGGGTDGVGEGTIGSYYNPEPYPSPSPSPSPSPEPPSPSPSPSPSPRSGR
jgi:hypothetical protein